MAGKGPTVTLDVGADGVAVITISNPPVNTLAVSIFADLRDKYLEALRRDDVKAIVLTGDAGKFSGGFDINVFAQVQTTGQTSLLPNISIDLMVKVIEEATKPSVAALPGLTLGAGLEIAMCCHARIATPGAKLGLPELTLGIIPGAGGTQRLPRLVGLTKAIEMMLFSKFLSAKLAKEHGLVDAVISPSKLLDASRIWALDIANGHKPWMNSLLCMDKIVSISEAREIIKSAKQQAMCVAPHMPQHQACLDAIEEGILFGGYAGLLKEDKLFKDLVSSSTSKGLVHAFFAQRAASKVPNVTDIGLKPRSIKKVAVIGGGLMGSGIATALIQNNILVILKEVNSEYLNKGIKTIAANLAGLVKRGSISAEKMNHALSLLKGVLDYSEFKSVDMVIECAVEDIQLKQTIFSEVEKVCPPHCILASNTSTIDLKIVGEKTKSQDRIIGAHFFSPAHIMPLLEIVRSVCTSPQVILDVMTVGRTIKKVPVVVGNCTGFAVNRAFFPYGCAAEFLVHLGVDIFRIDHVITKFGMPMGPFQLQDLAGYGVALAVEGVFDGAFKGRTFHSKLLDLMVENGHKGKISGKGFYLYEKGKKPKPDLNIQPIVEQSRRLANIMPDGKPINVTDKDILEMILFPVVNEACRVMEEGIVVRSSDLDIASILGMGFPKFRGGLVFWADTVGAGYIYQCLTKWSKSYGSFFTPSNYLEERAKEGLPLSMVALPSGAPRSHL